MSYIELQQIIGLLLRPRADVMKTRLRKKRGGRKWR
jgi:hypothetical protein